MLKENIKSRLIAIIKKVKQLDTQQARDPKSLSNLLNTAHEISQEIIESESEGEPTSPTGESPHDFINY